MLRGVQQPELVEDQVDRPHVHGDVVQRQHEQVLVGALGDQVEPHHRTGAQVEGAIKFAPQPALRFFGVQLEAVDAHRQPGVDQLNRLAITCRVGGPQDVVAVDERLGRGLQRGHVEFAADLPGVGDGVGGAARRELVQKPQRALAVRQWMRRRGGFRLFHQQACQQYTFLFGGKVGEVIRHPDAPLPRGRREAARRRRRPRCRAAGPGHPSIAGQCHCPR